MQDQETNYRRYSLNKSRKVREKDISEAKQRLINKNRVNSLCVKAKTKATEALLLKIKKNTTANLRSQANRLMQSEIYSKYKGVRAHSCWLIERNQSMKES